MKKTENRIAIYSRKSRFTGKGESIGNQIDLCRDYVRTVFGENYAEQAVIFEDEGFSGSNLKRPDFQKMMEQVRKHRFQAIVVYRLDRISRNISDFTGLIDELTKLNVSFVSIREQFDTGTPMGRAMMFIISVFSQLERETIAERIRDNMHELAKTGRWLGGNTPTGYISESVSHVSVDGKNRRTCRLKLCPEEAETVKTVFDLYTETDSLTAVEAELLRMRLKTKQGNDFTRFSIRGILQNPVYMVADQEAWDYFHERGADLCSLRETFDGTCGIMAYNRTEQEKGKTTVVLPVSEWIVARGDHPGLIPSGQWIRIQASLDRNKSKAYRKPRRNEALLTGLLFCSCGERMYPRLSNRTSADGKTGFAYVCRMKERSRRERCDNRNVNGNLLDERIMEQIESMEENDVCFLSQLEKSRQTWIRHQERPGQQLAALREELTAKEKTVAGLIDSLAWVNHPEAKARVAKRIEDLSEISREIGERIREVESLASEQRLTDTEFDELCKQMASFRLTIGALSVEEKRAAVRGVIQKVTWDGEIAHVVLLGANEEVFQKSPETHWCEDSK